MQILNTLAPVFLLIAVGAGLQRFGFVSPDFLKEANRLTYWLGLPALMFTQLTTSFHQAGGAGRTLSATFVATVLIVPLGYLVAWLMRVPGRAMGTFVQGGFRGNLAFVGLPIIFFLPDAPLASGMSIRTAAVVSVALVMVFYNIAAVVVLLLSEHQLSARMIWPFFKKLAATPPLIAMFAGMAFALADWTLPPAVDRAFAALGEMALPLGLLGVGGSLVSVPAGTRWAHPLGAALVKTVLSPIVGWAVGRALGLGGVELKTVTILMACPTSVTSYAVAVELKGDESLASGTIVLSVVTSLVSLIVVLAVM